MADRADMADRANSRVILPPMAYIDGKSEIISHWPTHWPTDSPNYKEMLSHLKMLGIKSLPHSRTKTRRNPI